MILLTAEEIKEAQGQGYSDGESVACAQLKKVVEWGQEKCPHPMPLPPFHLNSHYRRTCHLCWQALKKEAGG